MPQVEFDWDDANEEHIAEHGITPEEAEEAMSDRRRQSQPAYSTPTERRRGTLGATEDGRVLVVIYTYRRGAIRVVTARDANAAERRRYRR
jgi:uncharacterized protein